MDYIYLMQYDGRPDTVKLGIGRNGEASSYQTGAPERDAKMIFRMLTPNNKFIESNILKDKEYTFDHEWTSSNNIQSIKDKICILHTHCCEQELNDFNYTIINGWDYIKELEPSKFQRPHDDKHVKFIAKSIKQKGYLLHPILATEDYKITDGNHRFRALQLLKEEGEGTFEMPIIINKNSQESDFVDANVGTKSLKPIEFVRPYALQGYPDYRVLADKLREYSTINATVVIRAYSKDNDPRYKAGEFELGTRGDEIMEIIKAINKVTNFNSTKSAWSNSINKIVRGNNNLIKNKLIAAASKIDNLANEGDITYELCDKYNYEYPEGSENRIYAI